jgi:murein DD-endopeptidase MepM/ murein hydrolase activator NlpD
MTSALGIAVQRIGASHSSTILTASAPSIGTTSHLLKTEERFEFAADAAAASAAAATPPAPTPTPKPDRKGTAARIVAPRVSRGAPRAIAPGMWPVSGPITGPFGERRGGHRHPGVDISAPTGTPIVITVPGTVVFAGPASSEYSGYGLLVIVDHGGGDYALYAHMSRVMAVKGEPVQPGMVIGLVGSTGHSTGSHLHFEIRRGGTVIDPGPWLVSRRPQS